MSYKTGEQVMIKCISLSRQFILKQMKCIQHTLCQSNQQVILCSCMPREYVITENITYT